MKRYLSITQIIDLHKKIIAQTGGSERIRDYGALDSAVAQPQMTFGGEDLYPSLIDKAVALGYSLIQNHPFVDGNKRIGHAAMEVFLVMNQHEIIADINEQEDLILRVASGEVSREELTQWLQAHLQDHTTNRST